ncbi:carboxylating nicotinate-nucleotide diphosphorylase [Candidatus Bathyarchaeota archaeon]|nr:carboxylating nicotinate-nucleotide diphosphorylase [Candidatus Bathyarchaeota archaeon]
MNRSRQLAKDKIKEFLREDLGYGDITSEALIPVDQMARAHLFFREPGIASGLMEASIVFELLGCTVEGIAEDGDSVEPGQTLLEVEGPAAAILSGERTALNIVSRMSGVATTTARIVDELVEVSPGTRVAATRKTLPGLRDLDKRAVEHGGGDTHRFRLDDCVLIKDNHLELVPSVTEAVLRAREAVSFTKKIEVEVRSLEEAEEAALAGADIIMFDNMAPLEMRRCLAELEERGLRKGFIYEASGGITPENAAEYAASGVDVISLGALTHSVRSLDVKLEIEMM